MKLKTKKTTAPKIHPTPGYALIQPLEAENKTASGIYLPDSTTEKPVEGKVIAVGAAEVSDCGTKKESPVKAGDLVVYKKWGGNEVKIDGKDYLFAKFEDILAIKK